MLYNDVSAEDHLIYSPLIFLVLYCQNHKYVTSVALVLNGFALNQTRARRFSNQRAWDLGRPTPEKKLKQGADIFNVARLINHGHFASAVFGDYVAAMLGLVAKLSCWTLDSFKRV